MKKCPHCGEMIPVQAGICQYCKKPVKRGTSGTRTANILQLLAACVFTFVFFYALLADVNNMIIEYGGVLLAITLFGAGYFLKIRSNSGNPSPPPTMEPSDGNNRHADSSFLNKLFDLDTTHAIWVEEEEFGGEKAIEIGGQRYFVKIPQNIENRKVVLRLQGLGKSRNKETGNLYLEVWLNKGEDIHKTLWLSERDARNGMAKKLLLDYETIVVLIPPNSYNGLTIRLKGLGNSMPADRRSPKIEQKKGNALVKLSVFPDSIQPKYVSFDQLSTEDMFLEGWVYRKFDMIVKKMGKSPFLVDPLSAETIADQHNLGGYDAIFHVLRTHLRLAINRISLTSSKTMSRPGECQKTVVYPKDQPAYNEYQITINNGFLDNPFTTTAILAHELCHVVAAEWSLDEFIPTSEQKKNESPSMETEHTVDLLVFMFKMGEFQLRAARDERLTLGYFNQAVFERMQVFVTRKLQSTSFN